MTSSRRSRRSSDKRKHGLLTGRIVVEIPYGNRSDQTVPQATSDKIADHIMANQK